MEEKIRKRTGGTEQGQELPAGAPWWSSDGESTRQCRGGGFGPWCGKIQHLTRAPDY